MDRKHEAMRTVKDKEGWECESCTSENQAASRFSREAESQAVADWSSAVLHRVKGANNRLSNGIVPLHIVCEQVGFLGVPSRHVSTGVNEAGLSSPYAPHGSLKIMVDITLT